MNKQANGQRAQAIKMGNIRPAAVGVISVRAKSPEEIAKSNAAAIAARRKEFARA
jgi:ribosomal protein L14E/L6E/L27E